MLLVTSRVICARQVLGFFPLIIYLNELVLNVIRFVIITSRNSLLLQLLLLLVSVYRYETEVSEPKLVESEAELLHKYIKDKEYNHDEIIRILTTRSKIQLISTFYRFGDICETPIVEVILMKFRLQTLLFQSEKPSFFPFS